MPETKLVQPEQLSLVDHVNEHGSGSAPYVSTIIDGFSELNGPDVADIAHYLCMLHGRHPGVVDHAATKTVEPATREWLVEAMEAFAAERAFLTKLTVAAGPISGVGAEDQSDAAVLAQRKALEMLSQSDRKGCALGASFALVLDWRAVRSVMEKIALRLNIEPRRTILPTEEETQKLKGVLAQTPAVERALNFGVDQLLAQHRGLWQLLDARRKARATF